MHFGRSIAIILITFSFARAVPVKDRITIAEVKQAAISTAKSLMQYALRNFIEIDEAIINARVLDQLRIQQIRNHMNQTISLFEKDKSTNSDLTSVLDDMMRILSLEDSSPAAKKAFINAYTNGALDDITEKNLQNLDAEIRLFTYRASPKIKKLTDETKQSEHELITAFNSVAYAGLVAIQDSFTKFLDVIEKY